MTALVRLIQILRRGPRRLKTQVLLGVGLLVFALGWMFWNLLDLVVFLAALLVGLYLISRALRGSRASSSSSSPPSSS